MPQPIDILGTIRALGNGGAVANARALLDANRHDEAVARDLARRLRPTPSPRHPSVVPAAGAQAVTPQPAHPPRPRPTAA